MQQELVMIKSLGCERCDFVSVFYRIVVYISAIAEHTVTCFSGLTHLRDC
jgi:hypothetical protein